MPGIKWISIIMFIILIAIECYGVYYVYINGAPNISVGGSKLIPENTVRTLIATKYTGLLASTVLFVLLNIAALLSMIKHRVFLFTLTASPGILGFITALFYVSSTLDKLVSVYALVTYFLAIVYAFKREL